MGSKHGTFSNFSVAEGRSRDIILRLDVCVRRYSWRRYMSIRSDISRDIPMVFFCQQCGECCSHMSQIHRIEVDYGDLTFQLCNNYTGERRMVRVDSDKIHLFQDRSIFESWPEACPFLRGDPLHGRICCTVHQTRPDLCREFGCWRILILDSSGKRAGRIMGTRHLSAEDPVLLEFWKAHAGDIQALDDASWDRAVVRILERSGYRVLV
jgi:Fe-S-cluster containining protein